MSEQLKLLVCPCGKTRPETGEHQGWLNVWRHSYSVVVSVRPWDQTVAVLPGKDSFCSLKCAMLKVELLTEECVADCKRGYPHDWTGFRSSGPQQANDSDATGFKT